MDKRRETSIPVRRGLSKRGENLKLAMAGQGQDPDRDDDDKMEVAGPRACYRRSLLGREKG
eukprot:4991672-Prorocentrum_lima.AAC.1